MTLVVSQIAKNMCVINERVKKYRTALASIFRCDDALRCIANLPTFTVDRNLKFLYKCFQVLGWPQISDGAWINQIAIK